MHLEPSLYEVPYFTEQGFMRRKCVVCGEYFWTLDPQRKTCGDSPCDPYDFFEKHYTDRSLDVSSMRARFIGYFAERGHKPIPPREVVARWRDDIYLTIASIVLFQPFVTSGQASPPANPLVVSQPCIRLTDIDNVGLTAGRHMTIFEMGGHHAFNYPDHKVYWKDETVAYAYDFFSKQLGIAPENITLKESVWIGGGNAGPCFEVAVGGLEVATLVFMEYNVEADGSWSPLPLKIVDTGYGIERMSWLSQRAPTGFHAVYGDLVDKFAKLLEVDLPPPQTLFETARYSALMKVEGGESIKQLRLNVAAKLGLDPQELERVMVPAESMFGVLDHTKTLSFMLADGIVPSNTGEGYLARLVLRRALRLMRRLRKADLSDLVALQLEFWGKDYPKLVERSSRILEEVGIEQKKYSESLIRAGGIVESTLKHAEKTGGIKLEELVELYDSHGVDPTLIAEEAAKRGSTIDVPDNFFTLVAQKHGYARQKTKKADQLDPALLPQPKTKKLYYDDPQTLEFEAKIIWAQGEKVVLDQTCFYPEGGGQPSDTGEILVGGTLLKVVDVQVFDGVIVHYLEKNAEEAKLVPGLKVHGRVDADRRLRHTQNHDATHVLLASIRRVLGEHIWQAGAQKGYSYSRLDVTHYKKVSDSELEQIERLANSVIQQNRRIVARFMERNEAEEKYGYSIYQGGVVPGSVIRVVEIEDFDVEACGGTHSEQTGSIGSITIMKIEYPQDGVVRFIFTAGASAVEWNRKNIRLLEEVASNLKSPVDQLAQKLRGLIEENKTLNTKLNALNDVVADLLSEKTSLINTPIGEVGYLTLNEEDSVLDQRTLATRLANTKKMVVFVFKGRRLIVASPTSGGYDISDIVSNLKARSGKGGGGKVFAEYLFDDPQEVANPEVLIHQLTKTATRG